MRIRHPLGLDSTRFGPNWNVAPTHQVPALRRCEGDGDGDGDGEAGRAAGGAELVALRWGLIPSWAKGVALKSGTIMATCGRPAKRPWYIAQPDRLH